MRLGWQIAAGLGGNQMSEYFDHAFRMHGRIEASVRHYPACSFLPDTAGALTQIMQSCPGCISMKSPWV